MFANHMPMNSFVFHKVNKNINQRQTDKKIFWEINVFPRYETVFVKIFAYNFKIFGGSHR